MNIRKMTIDDYQAVFQLWNNTAVSNAARKQGVGTKLVNAAIAALKKQGINKVALVAFETNEL